MKVSLTLLTFLFCFWGCKNTQDKISNDDSSQGKHIVHRHIPEIHDTTRYWKYNEKKDTVHKVNYFSAFVEATTALDNDKYSSHPTLGLIYENVSDSLFVSINISPQDFVTSIDSMMVKVKFDNQKTETFQVHTLFGAINSVYFDEPEDLFDKIKHSKVITVEANIVSMGKKDMFFPVIGLDWE